MNIDRRSPHATETEFSWLENKGRFPFSHVDRVCYTLVYSIE